MADGLKLNAFGDFKKSIHAGPRYIQSQQQMEFLSRIKEWAERHIIEVPAGEIFFRCQRVVDKEDKEYRFEEQRGDRKFILFGTESLALPAPEPRLRPRAQKAVEGRANPKGIPYFYCANNEETAVTETRPIIEDLVTVGAFTANRSLRLVSFEEPDNAAIEEGFKAMVKIGVLQGNVDKEEIDRTVEFHEWFSIGIEFSKPTERLDDIADYAPTQIIAEYIKSLGYDGVAYSSSLSSNGGVNYALFDGSCLDLKDRYVMQVKSIQIEVVRYRSTFF